MGRTIYRRLGSIRNSVRFGTAWNDTVSSRAGPAREMGQDRAEDSQPVDQARHKSGRPTIRHKPGRPAIRSNHARGTRFSPGTREARDSA